jgi:hypothetical protein
VVPSAGHADHLTHADEPAEWHGQLPALCHKSRRNIRRPKKQMLGRGGSAQRTYRRRDLVCRLLFHDTPLLDCVYVCVSRLPSEAPHTDKECGLERGVPLGGR